MKNDYNTRQRIAVLNCLKSNGGHLTAAQIADILRSNGEKAGLATIYRRLDKLVEMGLVRKYITDKVACYQYAEGGCKITFICSARIAERFFMLTAYIWRHWLRILNSTTVLRLITAEQ